MGRYNSKAAFSRRAFLNGSSRALAVAGLGWIPLSDAGCAAPTTPATRLPTPDAFPTDIPLRRQLYQNWSGEIRVDGMWTAAPTGAPDVARIVQWAADRGYRIRARGAMHGWSPITIVPGSDLSRTVLVDTAGLTGLAIDTTGLLPTVTVGAGVHMDDLLETLGRAGLGLASTPATGGMTVGGALAVDAHGGIGGAAGQARPTGLGFGSISNQVVALDAVVWEAGGYRLRRFLRSDPAIGPLLTHIGRGFVTAVTLQVGASSRIRCQSFTDISTAELFADPAAVGATTRTFGRYLDETGWLEAIWYPFTDRPWLKVWTPTTTLPSGSITAHGPYNYAFSDHIDEGLARMIIEILDGSPQSAPDFGRFQLSLTELGLTNEHTRDLWGWAHDLTRYIRATTLRITEGGGAILCRRSDVQKLVSTFATWHQARLVADAHAGRFPVNGPVEIRCSGLDHPDVVPGAAGPPTLSALRPRADRPELDIAVWINVLTVPGTPGAAAYYHDLERWFLALAAGGLGVFRSEWAKGWAFSNEGAWADPEALATTIPASFEPGEWRRGMDGLNAFDPSRIYSNPFMDTFLT